MAIDCIERSVKVGLVDLNNDGDAVWTLEVADRVGNEQTNTEQA